VKRAKEHTKVSVIDFPLFLGMRNRPQARKGSTNFVESKEETWNIDTNRFP